jgi:23S rRNA (cytidine1920-2'-O)/16S rRNA (cytidine1409-2'-O)-methyltransferase
VYCVDVGYGLLDWKLRQDGRVVVLERTNARHLTRQQMTEPLDLAVIDASFISLEPLLAPLMPLFRDAIRILALVKPQFQLPREMVGPGGIVEDATLHQQSLAMVRQFGQNLGLHCAGIVASPVRGAKGNQEFFMLLTNSSAGKNEGTINLEQGDCDVVSTTD